MRYRIAVTALAMLPFCLASAVASANGCGDYPLTEEQATYLQVEVPDVEVPDGEVPFVQRCDANYDGLINNDDLVMIREHRGQPAAHPDDPMDWDGNGIIHGRDVGGCASSCTNNSCSANNKGKGKNDGGALTAQAAEQTEMPGGAAACYQRDDFDGDGAEDFIGVYEYTGSQIRGNNWDLQLVILTEDGLGNVQHNTFPYSGQVSASGAELMHHVSLQPAGTVDLAPGTVELDQPGIVAYREGEPRMLIYYDENGNLAQAFYGIDD